MRVLFFRKCSPSSLISFDQACSVIHISVRSGVSGTNFGRQLVALATGMMRSCDPTLCSGVDDNRYVAFFAPCGLVAEDMLMTFTFFLAGVDLSSVADEVVIGDIDSGVAVDRSPESPLIRSVMITSSCGDSDAVLRRLVVLGAESSVSDDGGVALLFIGLNVSGSTGFVHDIGERSIYTRSLSWNLIPPSSTSSNQPFGRPFFDLVSPIAFSRDRAEFLSVVVPIGPAGRASGGRLRYSNPSMHVLYNITAFARDMQTMFLSGCKTTHSSAYVIAARSSLIMAAVVSRPSLTDPSVDVARPVSTGWRV